MPFGSGMGWVPALGFAVAIGIAYYLAAQLGLALRAKPGVAVFWPAAGIAAGALIAWGASVRLPVTGAVIVGTALANFVTGRNAWLAGAFGLINAGQSLLTASLIERTFGTRFKLESVPHVLALVVAGAIGCGQRYRLGY